jgi:PQQ-dependent dehydrogenase (s-GDH family)
VAAQHRRFTQLGSGVLVLALAAAVVTGQGPENITRSTETFVMRLVATGLAAPWEVAYGPDQHLWVTEREGKRIVRINPVDGTKTVLATLPDVYQNIIQDGLLGLALHPDLLRNAGRDFVYVSFTYEDASGGTKSRLAIRRYRYDPNARALVEPTDVLRGLPASDDHVGGRLAFGPEQKLYLTIGDQGANFGQNRCTPNRAQEIPREADVRARNWSAYAGKVLRINLDGSIPDDNPVVGGVRSHVFSYGHRNPLGIVFGPGGRLYESEHGPETDDELNLIEAGRNYGWPHVAGFRDDKTYVYANWSASAPEACASLPGRGAVPVSVPAQVETSWTHPQFAPPLRTFFTFDTAAAARQAGGGTMAPGGLDIHTGGGGVPGWGDSLLALSMLKGVVYRVPLAADGRSVREPPVEVFKTTNRYRDIAVHPDRRTFYLVTDPAGRTSDDTGTPTQTLANPGSVLAFTYAP